MRRLSKRPQNAPELMSPAELQAQKPQMLDPKQLFQGVTVRPSQIGQTRELIAQEGIKDPSRLFGDQCLAAPGQALSSPHALDILPGQPLPEINLVPLPSDAEIEAIQQRLAERQTAASEPPPEEPPKP